MEDDGILLNFSTTPKQVNNSKVKRGNTRGVQKGNNTKVKAPQPKLPVTDEDTTKNESAETEETSTSAGVVPGTKILHGKAQVISSLFSSIPAIPTTYHKKSVNTREEGASNAPLDSSSFIGIGIESDLADNLNNKLNVVTPTKVQAKAIPILLGPVSPHQTEDVDVIVQAETGSGKTLTYLLPIVNRLIAASTASKDAVKPNEQPFGDRTVGTVAIILTPTRELAQQVHGVLTTLVNLPRPKDENIRRLHWIVPGIVIGGDSKAKEKARLRKGVNILVSTPGRLLDHLENTKSFDISHLKWLVLDEADRLLDLGFEETLKKIMNIIIERTKQGSGSPKFKQSLSTKYWPKKRQTILCSATLREDVKELAGWSLDSPAFVSATDSKRDASKMLNTNSSTNKEDETDEMKFTTPNQLKQTYTIVPAKLRLITLLSLIRSSLYDKQQRKNINCKVIVFLSCCDSVDFHYNLFANAGKPILDDDSDEEMDDGDDDNENAIMQRALKKITGKNENKHIKKNNKDTKEVEEISQISTLLLEKPVFRLHGDLNQQIRSQTFAEFSKVKAGVLFCTDVAARGLDLPNVDHIIQYDVPTDLKDYVHRVGRTARLGKAGRASLFLLPSEMEYLDILKAQDLFPEPVKMESILENLAEYKNDYQTPAQELQNSMENYILSNENNIMLARKAFWSTCRAYATHPGSEKHIFHIKRVHLGHLAKSFALREAPSNIHERTKNKKKKDAKNEKMPGMKKFEGKEKSVGSRKNISNPLKRNFDHASEFAIASATSLTDGPTTKKKKKNKGGKK
ncbi:P-loop containing nucleoside triphosphate hydrolase protein [Cokeromyces recurvatus]|uniref:P-loop containing nucleoside triphosphate hydrolase protein n=1 Tax=Cokeromyces recurvatus TaxID=90255 RepID=UPI00221EBD86|nr:P-loop containing nucleoside triphosphate hydrolase protein [Cokeromyces recurvatus]KAI7906074.1 P-loop containing nucleoside triphosphate hydrolase protein [Cokeromyces recurvatus]